MPAGTSLRLRTLIAIGLVGGVAALSCPPSAHAERRSDHRQGRHERHDWRGDHRPFGHGPPPPPYYAPPPVVYAPPPPPPGLNVFLNIR